MKSKKHKKEKIDVIIYFFAYTTPLFELPQLYTIIHSGNAQHVSIITWAYLALSSFAWLIYGVMKKVKPLIVSYILYTSVETAIVVAILLFQ